MKQSKPLVTINILSWNRKKDLGKTLQKLNGITYPNIEIIVVDNASSDGSSEMVEKKFPKVKLIKMPKNYGISGWNWGFKSAKGKYVLVLDDDSYPEKSSIEKMVKVFETTPSVGAICFKILHPSTNRVSTKNWNSELTGFCGCGTGIRVSALNQAGYYSYNFFLYMIERDLALRIWEADYTVIYKNDIIAYHGKSPVNRTNAREIFYNTRNQIWFILKYFSSWRLFFGTIRSLSTNFVIAFKEKELTSWLKGFLEALIGSKKILSERKKASLPVQNFYYYTDVLFEPIKLKVLRIIKKISYEKSRRYKEAKKYIPNIEKA